MFLFTPRHRWITAFSKELKANTRLMSSVGFTVQGF